MRAFKTPLEIEDIQISKPGPRELLVRTVATGVCHSDLHVMDAASEEVKRRVIANEDAGSVKKAAVAEGMSTLRDDGVLKVLDGFTTFEEIRRVTAEDGGGH